LIGDNKHEIMIEGWFKNNEQNCHRKYIHADYAARVDAGFIITLRGWENNRFPNAFGKKQ